MSPPRSIDNYGGVKVDAEPVEDPTTELSADQYNRLAEDAAQMTRTSTKIFVKFATSSGGAGAITPTAGQAHRGTASGDLPTIAKTATGLYDITYPSTFVDALGVTENVGFTFSSGRVKSLSVAGSVYTTEAGNIIHVAVRNSSDVLSDLGGGVTIEVDAL